MFIKGVKEYAEKLFSYISELDPDIEVVMPNVQKDHVHTAVVIPPRYAVARVVLYFKSKSAKTFKAKFPFPQKTYFAKKGILSLGYRVSYIGLDEKEILA